MKQLKLFFCCLISIVSFTAYGQPQGGAQWEMVFSEHHLVGTFVLKHLETGNFSPYIFDKSP